MVSVMLIPALKMRTSSLTAWILGFSMSSFGRAEAVRAPAKTWLVFYVGAMLEKPDAYDGKYVAAAGGVYSFQEVADILSRVSGKKVGIRQIPEDGWKAHMPEVMQEEMADMMTLFQDYRYYGKETDELVKEGRKGVSDVTTFEDFVKQNLSAMGLT